MSKMKKIIIGLVVALGLIGVASGDPSDHNSTQSTSSQHAVQYSDSQDATKPDNSQDPIQSEDETRPVEESTPDPETTPETAHEPQITTKTETAQTPIPFETITQDDPSLAKGTSRVSVAGVEGIRENTYTITFTDGVETNRELTSSRVIKAPVNKVVLNGTYVAPQPQVQQTQPSCQNGTYINSAGNTVCRPSSSNNGGATAICRDGTYSYSQSRRGTCSHHGGVSRWL